MIQCNQQMKRGFCYEIENKTNKAKYIILNTRAFNCLWYIVRGYNSFYILELAANNCI